MKIMVIRTFAQQHQCTGHREAAAFATNIPDFHTVHYPRQRSGARKEFAGYTSSDCCLAVSAMPGQTKLSLTGLQIVAVGVIDHRKAEEEAVGKAVVLDDRDVLLLGHEAREGAEPSVADELGVAQLARGELQLEVDPNHRRLLRRRMREQAEQFVSRVYDTSSRTTRI